MDIRDRIEYLLTAKPHWVIGIAIVFCAIIGLSVVVAKVKPILFPSCEQSIAEYEEAKRKDNPMRMLAYMNIPDKCNYR